MYKHPNPYRKGDRVGLYNDDRVIGTVTAVEGNRFTCAIRWDDGTPNSNVCYHDLMLLERPQAR